jgi:kanamycin kinase
MPEISQIPTGPVAVPEPIRALAGADPITPVWLNEVGGITFQLGAGPSRRFAKWAPHGRGLDLFAEEARLRWAVDFARVPEVLEAGSTAEADWLVTAGLPGRSAVDPVWRARPADAVRELGLALRHFHDTVPVDECPFEWTVDSRVAHAMALGKPSALLVIPPVPEVDRLVVCHGDPCAPNTLIGDDGSWTAHVDLDALGIGDRWADIAVATMSLGWNYGPGWDAAFLDAYGIAPDPERTAFYRALWDAT